MSSCRRQLADWLRMWADRIDETSGPRLMGPHSFTIEHLEGIRFRQDGRGCPLWYMNEEYDRAHDEADTEHVVVNWQNVNEGLEPRMAWRGGQR